jgi:hypothetical protein
LVGNEDRSLLGLVWVAAAAYLVVGACWLFADRSGIEPVGVGPPLVQLTAIHFHYAGFASSILVGCAWRALPGRSAAVVALVLTVGSPPLIAVGFTFFGLLQIVGAVLLTVGLWLLAWVTVRHIAGAAPAVGRALLVISSFAVLVPMVLAIQWAVGVNYGTPALSIPDMARTHGVINAVGFALLAVIGWRLLAAERG